MQFQRLSHETEIKTESLWRCLKIEVQLVLWCQTIGLGQDISFLRQLSAVCGYLQDVSRPDFGHKTKMNNAIAL